MWLNAELLNHKQPKKKRQMDIHMKKMNRKGEIIILTAASLSISSHLGFISSGLCQSSVWCANKESEGVRERE